MMILGFASKSCRSILQGLRRAGGRPIFAVLLLVLMMPGIVVARADVLFDEFDGGSGNGPNHSNWTNTAGLLLNGSGALNFNNTSGSQTLQAVNTFAYTPSASPGLATAIFDVTQVSAVNYIIGLVADSTHLITVRNDLGGGVFKVYIQNGTSAGSYALAASSATGVWQITWQTSKVKVALNGSTVFDSSVNAPNGGGSWSLPTMAMVPSMTTYSSTGVVARLNSMTWNTSILWDNFPGTSGSSPSSTYWNYTAGITLTGANAANFNLTGGAQTLSAKSAYNFTPSGQPAATSVGKLRMNVSHLTTSTNLYFGLTDGSNNYILIRNDMGSGTQRIYIQNGASNANWNSNVTAMSGDWEIDWMVGKVIIYKNGTQWFDSSTTAPTGGGSWSVPTAAMAPVMANYTGTGVASRLNGASWGPAGKKGLQLTLFGGLPGSGGQPSPLEIAGISGYSTTLDTLPATGFIYNPTTTNGFFPDASVQGTSFSVANLAGDVTAMQGFNLQNLTHNYARIDIGVTTAGWTTSGSDNTAWTTICTNAQRAASAAQQAGAEGILIDTEQYHLYASPTISVFNYSRMDQTFQGTTMFKDVAAQVRARGKQFMEAINAGYPNAKIMFTFATSAAIPLAPLNATQPIGERQFGFLPAFIDGMMDGGPNNIFIDGHEYSYPYVNWTDFAAAQGRILNDAAILSADPPRYQRNIKVGFGLFPEAYGETTTQLADALKYAWSYSDGYVWYYSESSPPWINGNGTLKTPHTYSSTVASFLASPPPQNIRSAGIAPWSPVTPNTSLLYYAKQTNISIDSGAGTNWEFSGDYVSVASPIVSGTGAVAFRPSDTQVLTGDYRVIIDVSHQNIKSDNGNPNTTRNGTYKYRLKLASGATGTLTFQGGASSGWITCTPSDLDSGSREGTVADTNFVAYGSGAVSPGASGYIHLQNVKVSDLVFVLQDEVALNYGIVSLKSFQLIPN